MRPHQVLSKYLKRKKASSRDVSIRSIARQVDVSAPFLSRVLRGEKPLPFSLLMKLGPVLEIEPEVMAGLRKRYSSLADTTLLPQGDQRADEGASSLADWDLVHLDAYQATLRQWFYIPILEFTSLKSYDGTAEMIARRMGLSPVSVGIALRELAAGGFLKEVDGRFIKTKKKFRWGSSKSLESIRSFHAQMLERARLLLKTRTSAEDYSRRLITGITLTTSVDRIEEGKRRLSEFLHTLANDLIDEGGTEVYQLSAQLFPLTDNPLNSESLEKLSLSNRQEGTQGRRL